MWRRSSGLRPILWAAGLLLWVGCSFGEPSGYPNSGPVTFGPGDSATGGADQTDAESGAMDPSAGPMTGDGGSSEGGSDSAESGAGCVPEAEVCDGVDNDCDGVEDNDDPGGGEACDTGMSGACAAGQTACEGGAIACVPLARSQRELCDNLDNDCDGVEDNGNPGGGAPCVTGMPGICADGTEICESGSIVCVADEVAAAEVCDGVDNDCDGVEDNGDPGGGGGCATGSPGICAAGTLTCTSGALECVPDQVAQPDEICGNSLDDDCNGMDDDGCTGGCPFGLCETSGMPQTPGCDPCVDAVCMADAFCCSATWDSVCVNLVETACGQADCVDPDCSHLVCDSGGPLDALCHPCVAAVCLADLFCCTVTWDMLCINAVATECGLACP